MNNDKNMPERNETRRSTAQGALRKNKLEGSQLKAWHKTPETHEQLAVGKKTSRSFAKILGFLEEMENKVNGSGEEGEGTGQ